MSRHLESRFEKDPVYAEGYAKVINEYMDEGNPPGRVRYLPHHGVVNANRPEKIRVVHDA